jgi:hypothetical protein
MSSTSGIGARTPIANEFTAPTQLTDTEASQSSTLRPARHANPGLEGLHSMRRAGVAVGDGKSRSATKGASASLAGTRSVSVSSQTSSSAEEDSAMIRELVNVSAENHADTCSKALRNNGNHYNESAVNQYADALLGLHPQHKNNKDFAKIVDTARQNCHEKIIKLGTVNSRPEENYFNWNVNLALKAFADAVSSAADKFDRPDAFPKRPVPPVQPRTSLLSTLRPMQD